MTKPIRKTKLRKLRLPVVKAHKEPVRSADFQGFPLEHYSYSSFTKFSTNPFMFKVNYLNGDQIETTSSPTNVLGRGAHKGLEGFLRTLGEQIPDDEGPAILAGHKAGIEYLKAFSDGFIGYNTTIPNRAKLDERYAFSFFGYIKALDLKKNVKRVLSVEKMLQHKVIIDDKPLPIPLKGSADWVFEDFEGRIRIEDHKFTTAFSNEDEVDGAKLLQAAMNYFLIYADLGRAPYSMIFREFKITENQDKTKPQSKEYEIIFEKHPLVFDFFYRFYEDMTSALLGKQVYVPNLFAMYDRSVSILAYIHRLDVDEERDKAFKKMKVDNITDFLKKRIQKDGAMKKYLDTVSQKFISAQTLNYKSMTIEERIKMKLAEHGLAVEFHSKIEGGSITQYRYEPSIGLKMSRIESYAKDIEQVVETAGIRILAPIPNTGLVGFEVPSKHRKFPGATPAPHGFEIPIGVDLMGQTVCLDIREAPHVLIAGATGSGKSVCMANIIQNVLTLPNSEVHLIDPKMVELTPFRAKAASYNEDVEDIKQQLRSFVADMDQRYKVLQSEGVRNIRELKEGHPMRYRFVFIDEFSDLMLQDKHMRQSRGRKSKVTETKTQKGKVTVREQDGDDTSIEDMIIRLAQKGRACGIHIVMATQRPSVDVISGVIKANFPTRIAFRTATAIDSQVIIDQAGAEKLLGKGDMLFLDPGRRDLERLQSFYV